MRNDHQDHQNRPTYNGLTEDEKALLLQRYRERCEFRQIEADLALIQAVQLGQRLMALKEADQ